ncbi:hypothetical protein [Bradyrhizobium sp. USDA 336]|uniref:hypothetical protein n=1 Tax=Bradyrhizobium sp. USDA 336 TaxID=3156311 RepID=UPI00383834AB
MTVFRQTADGSGFSQHTTGEQLAPAFSSADGWLSCDDAHQGGIYGPAQVTLLNTTIVASSPKRAARVAPTSRITIVGSVDQ